MHRFIRCDFQFLFEAKTAILSACRVASEIWEWGRREGAERRRARESSEEEEVGGLAMVGGLTLRSSSSTPLAALFRKPFSNLRQLDSSCLDR